MQQVRRKLASAVGPRLTGRCLTTLLDLKAPDRNPQYKLPLDTLRMWLAMWSSRPSVHAGITITWKQIAAEFASLAPAVRCRRIRGPQGAVISYLLDAGWAPESPSEWSVPGGSSAWQFQVRRPHRTPHPRRARAFLPGVQADSSGADVAEGSHPSWRIWHGERSLQLLLQEATRSTRAGSWWFQARWLAAGIGNRRNLAEDTASDAVPPDHLSRVPEV